MEQARKEKAPVPEEVWAAVVRGKEQAAVKDAAGDKAVDAARGKGKGKVAAKGKAALETSELLSRDETNAKSVEAWENDR